MLRVYWDGNFILAGRRDEEITETLEHYSSRGTPVHFPDEAHPITDKEGIVVFHMLPAADLEQEFLYFEPVEDVGFQVHPNAIMDLREQAMGHEKALRGGLYKINPKRALSRMPSPDMLSEQGSDPRIACNFFVPKDVMEALAHYKWEEFAAGYVRAGREREKKLRHPNIKLVNTVDSTIRRLLIEQATGN